MLYIFVIYEIIFVKLFKDFLSDCSVYWLQARKYILYVFHHKKYENGNASIKLLLVCQ